MRQLVLQEFVDAGDHSRFWEKVDIRSENECWLWIGGVGRYGYFGIWKNGKTHVYTASRVSLALHTGEAPERAVVSRHTCDNTSCVNPEHLIWGSQGDNVRDAVVRDRIQRGDRHYKAKLTDRIVREIRCRVAKGEKQNALVIEFGLSKSVVSKVVLRRAWRHVA